MCGTYMGGHQLLVGVGLVIVVVVAAWFLWPATPERFVCSPGFTLQDGECKEEPTTTFTKS